MMQPELDALDHLVITVRDLYETLQFYTEGLGMRAIPFETATERRWALHYGSQKINVHVAGAEFDPKAGQPTPGSADLCFLSSAPLESWLAHLTACGFNVLEGPVFRTGATGPLTSIYLRDPDGNLIEISNAG